MYMKFKRKYYYRKLLRLYLKSRRLEKELKDWGCENLCCGDCSLVNDCYLNSSIITIGKKYEKTYDKYSKAEQAYKPDKPEEWLINQTYVEKFNENELASAKEYINDEQEKEKKKKG